MRDDHENYHPDFLASLEEEQDFVQSQSKNRSQRIKVPKDADWLCRFIPAQLGPKGTPWARIAFHWINKRPYLCSRQTGRDFGGNPEGRCDICEVADDLNNSRNKKVSYFGYKAMAVPQWLMYALVFEKDEEPVRGDAKWDPWEFWMHKPVWSDFHSIYKKGLSKSPLSVLDWETGRDIWVRNSSRGYKLDREDSAPICNPNPEDPEKLKRIVKKILSKVNFKAPELPDDETVEEMVLKLQEQASRLSKDTGRDDRGRYQDEDDRPPRGRRSDDEDDRRSSRRSDDDEPPRGRRSDPDDDRRSSRNDEDDNRRSRRNDDDDRGRSTRNDEDDRRRSSRGDDEDDRRSRRSDEDDRGRTRRSHDEDDRRSSRNEEDEPPRSRRRSDEDEPSRRSSRQEQEREHEEDEGRGAEDSHEDSHDEGESDPDPGEQASKERALPPSRSKTEVPASRRGGYAESTVEEDDNAPEERRDPAPPSRPVMDENDEAPTDVAPPKSAPKASGLSSRLQAGIAGANRRP